MTDIELQKDIVNDLRNFFETDGIMMPLGKEFSELKVYPQDLPLKEDEDDEELRNYIVVMIGEQESNREEWNVEMHFSICIEDKSHKRSGNLNILYLMNEIYTHFIKEGIVGKHCSMENEAKKILNLEAPFPYYEGDLITNWKLPLPNQEGLEELV